MTQCLGYVTDLMFLFLNQVERRRNLKAETLKILRRQAGLTREELAKLMSVSMVYIQYMETGKRPITKRMLAKIKQVFKLDKTKKGKN